MLRVDVTRRDSRTRRRQSYSSSVDLKAPGGEYDHLIGDDLVADAIEDDDESEEEA